MTISTTASRISYNGNGATTEFSFPYRFLTNADLTVIKIASDGAETTLVLNTDYTVTGADEDTGGLVTLSIAPLSGQRLVIYRSVAITQEIDYITGDPFPAETHERALDRLTMVAQQQQDAIDRSAKLPVTSTEDADALIADIIRLADSADNIDTLAGIEADITDVAAIDANVTTVAGIAANVITVAGIAANVTSVAGNATNINAVAGNATNINAVNANKTNIDAVAANETNIDAVVANETNINAVAGNNSNITAVAGNASNINAIAANETNINTVSGIDADVTTVAGISSDVSAVAADAADIGTVATNIADVNTVADNIADVNTAATNIAAIIDAPNQATAASNSAIAAAASAAAAAASYDSFDDRYLGTKSSDPTLDNDGNALVTGALYYSSSEQAMKVYDGATWILASSAGAASMNVFKFVATAGQTTFSGAADVGGTLSYTSGNIIVFMNGAALDAADYTATDGTSIVLGVAASLDDELVIVAFKSFTVADTYTQTAADARFVGKDSSTGAATMPVGTTAQRPATPTTGMYRLNSTTGVPEFYSVANSLWIAMTSTSFDVETLTIAGGGGGGTAPRGGGGGAGGMVSQSLLFSMGQAYSITVGAGGAAGVAGSNSSISTLVSAIGGGRGGTYTSPGPSSGGSGGGGGAAQSGASGTAGQGNAGGAGATGTYDAGGGGGGAGAVGGNHSGGNYGGTGGAGLASSISGSSVTYAGGGGGATGSGPISYAGPGGAGGGGMGGYSSTAGVAGTANSGGGGGGAPNGAAGGAGGSGVVIIRYLGEQRATGGTVTSSGGYTIHTFTTSGTFTA